VVSKLDKKILAYKVSLTAINDDDDDNDISPVPTHHSQQNHSGSVLSLSDSKGAETAAQLICSTSILTKKGCWTAEGSTTLLVCRVYVGSCYLAAMSK
jgi:hypothetical protein